MKKELNTDEQRLLSHASLDELIKMKMEEELKAEFEKAKEKPPKQIITEIAKVPTNLIFSKQAVFRIFNRINKTENFINGMQAEAMLGLQNSIREKIRTGQMDAFSTDTAYIKFESIEI
ncbi:MAG: hypothetical protein PHC64_03270 [Candidatus Gastranaerophilales bacterium]|nr:hypothetical protein [Candidatus Gastranaerophilales bacterium]